MPSSGSGVGTPVSAGGGGGLSDSTQPLPYTLLSPNRYAEIIGITPPHFWGAAGATYFPDVNACSDVFYHYAWQNYNNVGRADVARALKQAEDDLAAALGFYPAPVWIEDEIHRYPRHHRRDVYEYGMSDNRGGGKSIKLGYGRFIQAGRRATSEVDSDVVVVYADNDGDGYQETATITATTTLTDECEIKCYFAGEGGEQDWEIRSPRSKVLSGGNITFTYWSWQLLDPDLQTAMPTVTGLTAIDLEDMSNYIASVDIYREYTDFTQASATLYWEPSPNLVTWPGVVGLCCSACGGTGCVACELTYQDGCIHVRDVEMGYAVPAAATYSATTGDWAAATLSVCRDPDMVKVWYYAGDQGQDYLRRKTCDPLSQWWAETIAWLATARIHKPFCTCNNTMTLVQEWQRDLSFTGSRELGSFQVSQADLDNPFGTRKGEVMAWKRVARVATAVVGGAV